MKRQKIEEFFKETKKDHIKLVVGIDPDPPEPTPNAIFYIRMESEEKKTGRKHKPRYIWLSLDEMAKLGILLTLASRFWSERLDKGTRYSRERIMEFKEEWKKIAGSVDKLLVGEV